MSSYERSFRRPANSTHSQIDSLTRIKKSSPDIYRDIKNTTSQQYQVSQDIDVYKHTETGMDSKADLSDISVEINLQDPKNQIFKDDYFDSTPQQLEPAFKLERAHPKFSSTTTKSTKRITDKGNCKIRPSSQRFPKKAENEIYIKQKRDSVQSESNVQLRKIVMEQQKQIVLL